MDLGLTNKIAIVAASSKGLGLSIVQNLLQEGALVIMNGRDEISLTESFEKLGKPDEIRLFAGDVTVKSKCAELVLFAIKEFGNLDIVVSNCGGPDSGKFEDLIDIQWQAAIDQSLLSHIFLIRAALPYLKKSVNPSILTITSFSVKQPIPNLILSNSIRAATVGLTKSLANELGSYGIRVNSILPGWTRTNRVEKLLDSRSQLKKTTKEQEMDQIVQSIPLQRMADPDEFGKVAAFLVSPAASYITGVMLNVDGGIIQGLF